MTDVTLPEAFGPDDAPYLFINAPPNVTVRVSDEWRPLDPDADPPRNFVRTDILPEPPDPPHPPK